MAERILFLDDDAQRAKAAKRALLCTHVFTAAACIDLLATGNWDEVYLDHDLGGDPDRTPATTDVNGQTGMNVVGWLVANADKHTDTLRVVVHSLNTVAAERMTRHLVSAGYSVKRLPFTKLLETWRDG